MAISIRNHEAKKLLVFLLLATVKTNNYFPKIETLARAILVFSIYL